MIEETVFENQECADILNEHFVSIKVDREEKADIYIYIYIYKHYQKVHNMVQIISSLKLAVNLIANRKVVRT
ncbi:DUF255 domain-containing protein [Candidatus Sulfurimonas marisnigri]|uniref:DUF255 domain-containing protein n=1 Tax=Candidatus Sulfurimonas marisnigri TaxID=2740405 RepID=UPI001E5DDF2D|nr:DUF255 domain-containing protein [Candidatus Sulfurimonas marisnigri]